MRPAGRRRLQRGAQQPNIVVTTDSTNTPADEALIQLGRTARMIVLGNSEVTAAGALFVGSTTLAVATHAACPVVAWRGPHTVPTNQPIVVGTDGTHSSAVALEAAFEFADRFEVKVAAVRSWSIPAGPRRHQSFADGLGRAGSRRMDTAGRRGRPLEPAIPTSLCVVLRGADQT